ncbi:hypothetical protein [Acidiphilium acidophilum]|uniref:Hydrophobic W protein n=1 Tax=Acidiphilium acidophilum TaxID=76588 RepID=A0AAW9DQU6_ACIAO|nr:hypothetical protein [Acidiphilium acidophilum]MDX5930783.1 hypothetical protein [Acidiphilium acidophilum]
MSKSAAKTAAATPAMPPVPEPAAALQAGSIQELKVSAHLMTLDTGLFCIVNEANAGATADQGLPGVRVSPPPVGGGGVEITGFRPDGWLDGLGDAALVRVTKGPAQVLVTVYQIAGRADASPRLQVMRLANGVAAPAPAPVEPEVMDVLAHIQTRGDVGAKFGDWLGEPGSANWIEGIAISAPDGIAAEDLSYQAVLGRGWLSPWVEAGAYCGSRGMALPLLGLRVRLQGAAAEQYELSCEASFIDGSKAGPVGSDETCEAESLAALEAVRLTLMPRAKVKAVARGRR